MSDKPREWFIDPDSQFAIDMRKSFISDRHATRLWKGIHVIEFSAYEALRAERDDYKIAYDLAAANLDAVKTSRDEARATLELMGNVKLLDVQREARIAQLEKELEIANGKADGWSAVAKGGIQSTT